MSERSSGPIRGSMVTSEGDEGRVADWLTVRALEEIARAFAGVDMASMPRVPDEAPCRVPEANPNDWFEPFRNSALVCVDRRFIDQIAEQLCAGCPVLAQCRAWALANPQQEGILGGLTHKARLALCGVDAEDLFPAA